MEFIDLKSQYLDLKEKIDKRIFDVLSHGQYIHGPEVYELEQQLSEYVDRKHTITCANGTDALSLALMALGIKPGDAVFCPTFTFFATAEVISLIGATPVFVDSDKRTFNICPQDLEKRILEIINTSDLVPKAIITVDLFGLPANYPEINGIAKKFDLKIIEDAAQGFGGSISGKRNCSFGDISTTSFFPAKPLGCYGDGGAVFTDDDKCADLLRSLSVHGKGKDKYDNVRIGLNSRLDTIQAAILIEKLNAFPEELEIRNRIAMHYHEKYGSKFITPYVPDGYLSSWAQYTLITEDRDAAASFFASQNIPTMVYYPKPLHTQQAFMQLKYNYGDFPISEMLANSVLSIPMHPYIKISSC
jgi:dTDP-4-amino-4,6-dideoxygalactose transaminase